MILGQLQQWRQIAPHRSQHQLPVVEHYEAGGQFIPGLQRERNVNRDQSVLPGNHRQPAPAALIHGVVRRRESLGRIRVGAGIQFIDPDLTGPHSSEGGTDVPIDWGEPESGARQSSGESADVDFQALMPIAVRRLGETVAQGASLRSQPHVTHNAIGNQSGHQDHQ